mmetsp:Transcript_47728/g.85941  ORF Transcript_47728/g.85941 Transcript_47728/m.85941 type:complete len:91 (-) Transcript_47728:29-301(-)
MPGPGLIMTGELAGLMIMAPCPAEHCAGEPRTAPARWERLPCTGDATRTDPPPGIAVTPRRGERLEWPNLTSPDIAATTKSVWKKMTKPS